MGTPYALFCSPGLHYRRNANKQYADKEHTLYLPAQQKRMEFFSVRISFFIHFVNFFIVVIKKKMFIVKKLLLLICVFSTLSR